MAQSMAAQAGPTTAGQGIQTASLPPASIAPAPGATPGPAAQIIFIQSGRPGPRVYENYAAQTSRFLGVGRIVIGVLSILLQIVAIFIEVHWYYLTIAPVGTGIWCGIFFILSGSFGIAAAGKKTFCMIVTNMVLVIVSVGIFGIAYVALSATAIGITHDTHAWRYRYFDLDPKLPYGLIAVHSLMFFLAVTVCIFEIWNSVICCKAVCCGRHQYMDQSVHYRSGGNHQVLYAVPGAQPFTTQQAFATPYTLPSNNYPYPQELYAQGPDIQPPAYTSTNNEEQKEAY